MLVSAVVCTHNRAGLLLHALDSLAQQTLCAADFEVVVVDNASEDGTADAVADWSASHHDLTVRYFYETRLGVSYARNRGIVESRAPLVAFMDDDCVAGADWLQTLVRSFEREQVRPMCAAGRILPSWEEQPPSWWPAAATGWLSIKDYGDGARPADFPSESVATSNLAFERSFLIEQGGFDTRLGRKGQNLRGGEDIMMVWRLKEAGGLIQYEPGAIVHHFLPKERLRFGWIMRRLFDEGWTDASIRHYYRLQRGFEAPANGKVSAGPKKRHAYWRRAYNRLSKLARLRRRSELVMGLMAVSRDLGAASETVLLRFHNGKTPDSI